MKESRTATREKPETKKPANVKPLRWPYAVASALAAALSTYEFRFYDTVPGAYDWSIRWLIAAIVAGCLTVWPEVALWSVRNIAHLIKTIDRIPSGTADKRYPNFDIARLVLASSVLFHHCWTYTIGGKHPFATYAAVPAFLCISGFVVLASFERSNNWLHFAYKRLLRVGPAFVLSLLLTFVLLGPLELKNSLLCWATLGLTHSNAADGTLWSLSCEEICYVLLAVGCLLGFYRRPSFVWASLIISVHFMGRINYPSEFAMRTATLPTAFIVGNLIYLYRSLLLRVHRAIPSVVAGIAILSLGWQFQSPSAIILHTAFVAGSIVWFCIAGPTVRIKLQGDFSYGIYVYHLPILTVVLLLTGHRSLHIAGPLTFALSLTLAALSWFSIERKFLALKNLRVLNELGEITQDKRASFPPKSVLDDAITEPNIKVLKID